VDELEPLELVPVAVAAVPLVVADVTSLFAAQKPSYHVLISCKLVASVQLAGPHTELTPAVPESSKGVSRVSVQKQLSLISAIFGGVHAPCTSKRGPHLEAQAGSTDEKGTISPSGDAVASVAEAVAD